VTVVGNLENTKYSLGIDTLGCYRIQWVSINVIEFELESKLKNHQSSFKKKLKPC